MKLIVEYYEMQSDHLLAMPEYDREEFIEVKNEDELDRYISTKKDWYGCEYKKDKSHGFDYISGQGGIKIKEYEEPKFRNPIVEERNKKINKLKN